MATTELKGLVQTWNLTEDPARGRKYIVTNTNYGTYFKYFQAYRYNVENQQGEQRENKSIKVKKLKDAIINGTYTPTSVSASILENTAIAIDGNKATIQLDENNKLAIVDGDHRFAALSQIRQDDNLRRKVDNLPITAVIYLEPERRKEDFVNLNIGFAVNRNHLLNLQMDSGKLDSKKAPYYKIARELALRLNKDTISPFKDLIQFSTEAAPLSFSILSTIRSGSLIQSLYTTTKFIEKCGYTQSEVFDLLIGFHQWLDKNSSALAEDKLLEFPPNGARGSASLFLGIFNVWLYYIYLNNRKQPSPKDYKALKGAIHNVEVDRAGDLSTKRCCETLRLFSQDLFSAMAEDEDSKIAFHHGLPVSLLINSSCSSFAVDTPSREFVTAPEDTEQSEVIAKCGVDSDTDEQFLRNGISDE
jgi:DNA-sulfur modification-associated